LTDCVVEAWIANACVDDYKERKEVIDFPKIKFEIREIFREIFLFL